MEYRQMGRTGLKLSAISLGAWITFGEQIDDDIASTLIHYAYDQGINFFDNADIYASGKAEETMGKIIKDLPREALILSSKVFWPTMPGPNGRGLSRKHIFESCHASLKRMGVDYLDLYFCHRYDPETPLDEVVSAMDDLVHQGKVLYWGTSEWSAAQITHAHSLARQYGKYPPMVEQPHYNMLVRQRVEADLAPAADDLGFGMVTWSPLRSGLLSGKYNAQIPEGARLSMEQYQWLQGILTDEGLEAARQLETVAKDMGVSLAQLAIGWLLRIPQVTSVITGATKLDHLKDNLKALDVVDKLDSEILDRIETVLGNAPKAED